MVKAEDGLFQPVARCPLVVFLRHRAAQVVDGIVQCPALLVTNHSHAALVALPVRIPIGRIDGKFRCRLDVGLGVIVTNTDIDGCLLLGSGCLPYKCCYVHSMYISNDYI